MRGWSYEAVTREVRANLVYIESSLAWAAARFPTTRPWVGWRVNWVPKPVMSCVVPTYGFNWSHPPGSNWRPADYESAALPTELGWRAFVYCNLQGIEKADFLFCAGFVPDTP
jgi:hypothetical protein